MALLTLLACTAAPPVDPAAPEAPDTTPRLHADGTRIVDPDGNPVVLRGVNLGGWMFHETWITNVDYPTWGRFYVTAEAAGYAAAATTALQATGQTDDLDTLEAALAAEIGADAAAAVRADTEARPSIYDDSDLPLRQLLETRFGADGRDALLDTFQAAWITESDIEQIAGYGFNLVRVPMGYRSLVTNSDLEPLTALVWNEPAFDRIDALLDACERHGVYAILDIQESPGGHNGYSGEATLYTDPEKQLLTVALWEELSRRYGERDHVAAYSLLAEPMSAPSIDASMAMYDQLHDAIRAQGDDHLLVVHDGFFGMWELPPAADMGWENVVYSTHLFEWGASAESDYEALIQLYDVGFGNAQATQDVPYFIGSFSTMRDEAWAYASAGSLVDWYEDRGWSWSWWTWKRIDDPLAARIWGERTGWGVLRDPWDGLARPDVWLDDRATLEASLAAYGGRMAPNEAVVAAIAPFARD